MKTYTSDERSEILAEWRSSGLSGKAFAVRRGVSAASLYEWRKLQCQSQAAVFRPVIVRDTENASSCSSQSSSSPRVVAEIVRDGVVVRIHAGISSETLASIVPLALGGSTC